MVLIVAQSSLPQGGREGGAVTPPRGPGGPLSRD